MKITHRASAPAPAAPAAVEPLPTAAAPESQEVPRLSCCCRLSELLPLVRQAHDAARAARQNGAEQPGVAA